MYLSLLRLASKYYKKKERVSYLQSDNRYRHKRFLWSLSWEIVKSTPIFGIFLYSWLLL